MADAQELAKKLEIVQELERRKAYEKISNYDPLPYQDQFHETGRKNNQRLLMAANRIGKSYCGAAEMAFHLTGLYPKWWTGKRYDKCITAWACGVSNETTRDIVQNELCGTPEDSEAWGTGMIPKDLIVSSERRPGVPNAKSSILVKHKNGRNSTLHFKSYEQGVAKFMGKSVDCIWLDEEPPNEIYSQCVTRTLDRKGMVYMTFTPESGMTDTVASFINDIKKKQSINNATWDDAKEDVKSVINKQPGHLTADMMEQVLNALPPHEREMRSRGVPVVGSGLVFPLSEDDISVESPIIQDHWLKIAGIDFGWDHPTAVVWGALDQDADIFYVYDVYSNRKMSPIEHSRSIIERPHFIPIAYPHDGNRRDSMGNPGLAEQYRRCGCNVMLDHFSNPPGLGQKKGTNSVEEGIQEMYQYMQEGKFKVAKHLLDWFNEFRMYHRKDGKIVALRDDIMSATRYCFMSRRFGVAGEDDRWSNDLNYKTLNRMII